jgi:hypothetical protein
MVDEDVSNATWQKFNPSKESQREVSDNSLQLSLYQAGIQQGQVNLGTGEIVDVQQALQLGWRPTMPKEEDNQECETLWSTVRDNGLRHGDKRFL